MYLLWYGPVIAINLLLLNWMLANTLVSAEAALLNLLLTAGFRNDHMAVALNRAAVWSHLSGRVAECMVNRMAHQLGTHSAKRRSAYPTLRTRKTS